MTTAVIKTPLASKVPLQTVVSVDADLGYKPVIAKLEIKGTYSAENGSQIDSRLEFQAI